MDAQKRGLRPRNEVGSCWPLLSIFKLAFIHNLVHGLLSQAIFLPKSVPEATITMHEAWLRFESNVMLQVNYYEPEVEPQLSRQVPFRELSQQICQGAFGEQQASIPPS